MRPRQEAFHFDHEDETSAPLVYLACRLTGLSENERRLLDSWCTHVTEAVAECADEGERPWKVRVHAALNWSPPWSDHRDSEAVYDLNSRNVAACSAVIVLSIDGGGLGVGQEFAWATALRLPVLLLHPSGSLVSRQALGTPGDVTVVEFDTASALTDVVRHVIP